MGRMLRWIPMMLLLFAIPAFAQQSVGNQLPPVSAQNLTARYGNGVLGQTVIVTNVSAPCSQGATPTFTGATTNTCRAASTGSGWKEIITAPGASNTFSVANACSTSARAVGGCTNNQVSYGAGGIALPTLNAGNTSTVTCIGTSGDTALLTAAAGTGGTSGNRKGVKIQGAKCDMRNGPFVIPPFTDVQCANSSTVICNPSNNTALSGQCNPADSTFTGAIASFQINGPNQGGSGHDVTISNCTFQELNTQPPTYPGCTPSGAGCSPPPGNSFQVLDEHASNVTVEDNLFRDTTGQAAAEALGGSGTTPDSSNVNFIWNTYDSCALYGATSDNIINSTISHNYYRDCRFGNEMDNSGQTGGSYVNNYNYLYVNLGIGYYDEWCGGFGGIDGYCTLHAAASCQNTGNIFDAGTNGVPPCPHHPGEFSNSAALFTLEGEGGTWSQNYCYNPANSAGCGCDSVGAGCTIGNPPNPAPSGP